MTRKHSARSLKNLQGVHPDLRRVFDRALAISDMDFVIIEGLRTVERQRQLVAAGASKTMNSRHLTGHAVDVCPMVDISGNGKVETSEMFNPRLLTKLSQHVKAAAEIEGVAIAWGGDWRTFKDLPHWELDRRVYPAK
jgi:peptidoglycan L-alanyl-D-glutamate endopeptidase CwlK